MAMISNDWQEALSGEFKKDYYRDLYNFIKKEYHEHVIYPPSDEIFNAFHYTPLSKVKVVILGQDPYHEENQAHGLSFSVKETQPKIPPSLQNIYKELHSGSAFLADNPHDGYNAGMIRQIDAYSKQEQGHHVQIDSLKYRCYVRTAVDDDANPSINHKAQ